MRAIAAILAAAALLAAGCGESETELLYAEAGKLYEAGRYAEALPLVRKAAEAGHRPSISLLGVMYLRGQGTAPDGREAVRWLVMAAEQGEVGAQSVVGLMYATGVGVPRDPAKAERWLVIAAKNGDAEAKRFLATRAAASPN